MVSMLQLDDPGHDLGLCDMENVERPFAVGN